MGSTGYADEILRVQDVLIVLANICRADGVHMMDQDEPFWDRESVDAKVIAFVADDHDIPDPAPFPSLVEILVEPAVESEGVFANGSVEF